MTENNLGVTEGDLIDTLDIARELITSGDITSKAGGAGLICAVAQVHATNNVAKAVERLAIALENQPIAIGPTAIPAINPTTSKSPDTGGAMDAVIGKGEENE